MSNRDDPRFGRIVTAMVTPFDDDGRLDLAVAEELAVWLSENGSDGLVLAGTTGESPTMTHDEELELARAVVSAVSIPVLLGTGSNDTATAVDATISAGKIGVAGVLVVTPYYNRPSQEGLYQHFATVAAATEVPVMLYDIPVRTGRKIEADTLVRLVADCPNVVALKDAAGDPAASSALIADLPDGVEVYSGDDALTLPLLSVGAVGAVSVASHWCGTQMGEMVRAFREGRVDDACRLNRRLLPSYEFEAHAEAPNPVPTKAMMRRLGFAVGSCRPPMGPEPDWLADRADSVLAGLA